jgi:AcrR family transcriptional regulator
MALANVNAADPRVKRTRRMLQDAFIELVREKGFESVTIQDLSERSTVNRATFYAHYGNKFDLAEDLLAQRFKERLRESVPMDSPVTETTLEALFRSVLGFIAEMHGSCAPDRQFGALLESAMYESMHEFASEWLGRSSSKIPRERAAATACVMSAAIIGVGVKSRSAEDDRPPEREFVRQVAAALRRAITGSGNVSAYAGDGR